MLLRINILSGYNPCFNEGLSSHENACGFGLSVICLQIELRVSLLRVLIDICVFLVKEELTTNQLINSKQYSF